MIYEFPSLDSPICQGDIFFGLPRIDIDLSRLPVVQGDSLQNLSWDQLEREHKPASVVLSVMPVTAVVISQDCDAQWENHISLCEIKEFHRIYPPSKDTLKPAKWVVIITQHSRRNRKWFYLPEDSRIGFECKMGVDFFVTIRVLRQDLARYARLRKARLNEIARAHFRERIAEFFRRYPYDEWYPLNQAEFVAYKEKYPDAPPFPWQK